MPLDQVSSIDALALNHATKVHNKIKFQDTILGKLKEFASSVSDFRRLNKGNICHRLDDVIMLIILARISGCIGRSDIIEFGKQHLKRLRKLGMLKNGVPSEATLCRIENGIDDLAFADRMQKLMEDIHNELFDDSDKMAVICMDGKAARGTVQENGRNPDIVSAYSPDTGIVLATEACQEKSNEIKAMPNLAHKTDIAGKVFTADAIALQKEIINIIRSRGGYFIIELKANQRSLRYSIEDSIVKCVPVSVYKEGPGLNHGRIETRTYRVYDGLDIIADKEKWGGNLTIIESTSYTIRKKTGEQTTEKRLYVSNLPTDTPMLGYYIRKHWSIESMHWSLDVNFQQDRIKRLSSKSARNLDTIQRIVYSVFSIWRGLRKKRVDKRKGIAELMRSVSMSFTKLLRFLSQKFKK